MITLGTYNRLEAVRESQFGMYLADEDGREVLLPNKYATGISIGESVTVFIYKDSEDRPVATTRTPKIQLHEFASLVVKSASTMGAFLDWGLEKDLFVPAREQKERMETGATYLVYMYLDEKSDRLVASSRLDQFLDNKKLTVKEGDKAEVIIWEPTDLGVKVIINQRHQGLIYHDQLFKQVQEGEQYTGYIHKIREDNKIDVSLQPVGFQKIEPNADMILEKLRAANGFLPYNDKSDPQDIQQEFEMSKKTFKKAIGNLYRKRIIVLDQRGIRMKKGVEK